MKATMISYIGFLALLIEVITLSVIISHSAYYENIRDGLEDSIEVAALETQQEFDKHELGKNTTSDKIVWDSETMGEFKKELINNIGNNITAKVDNIDMNIYEADAERGIISIEVKADFKYISGKTGHVSCYRTILLNTEKK